MDPQDDQNKPMGTPADDSGTSTDETPADGDSSGGGTSMPEPEVTPPAGDTTDAGAETPAVDSGEDSGSAAA